MPETDARSRRGNSLSFCHYSLKLEGRSESGGNAMTIEADRRRKLIEHLRERGIHDERVLAAVAHVPRDIFVGPVDADAAYLDIALPIACGQTISQPFVVAYMTEQLGIEADHDVLEIGTGSGYQAAILAGLCRQVYTIERHAELLEEARKRFAALGIANINAIAGDGSKGWPEPRQFNRILVTAAASKVPRALVGQLKEGGRMILPLGGRFFGQRLVLVEKTARGIETEDLLPVRFVPLIS